MPTSRAVLIGRFIDRSQRFRRTGAIVGLILMVAALVVRDALGANGGQLNLIVVASIGLAGSIGGSIVAEGFRVRRSGPRTASLEVREPASYEDRIADRREQVLLVLAGAGVLGAMITGHALGRVIALAVAVGAVAVARRWTVRRIALRPRPVLPPDVAAADDEVRRMAASVGTSRPMVTLAALAVSSQWLAVVPSTVDSSKIVQVVSVIGWAGSVVIFVTACRWWWANRSFGLTSTELEALGGPRSHLGRWILIAFGACFVFMTLLVLARGGS